MRVAYDLVQNDARQSDFIRAAGRSSEILLRDRYAGWQTTVLCAFNGCRGGILMSAFGSLPVFPLPTLMLSLSLCHTSHHGFREMVNVDNGSSAASLPPHASEVRELCRELEFGD